jgi:hypothetical protein
MSMYSLCSFLSQTAPAAAPKLPAQIPPAPPQARAPAAAAPPASAPREHGGFRAPRGVGGFSAVTPAAPVAAAPAVPPATGFGFGFGSGFGIDKGLKQPKVAGGHDNAICHRCGRGGHWASECYARKHVKGFFIRDS